MFGCAGLCCCPWTFSSCSEQGCTSLQCTASHCIGFSCCRAQALGHVGFSTYGAGALLIRGMWGLPRSGIEPVSLALQGRFLITGPPGKPKSHVYLVSGPLSYPKCEDLSHCLLFQSLKNANLN